MSLSKRATEPSRVRPRFSWIEHIGLPIANSVMVAQPVGLMVTLLALLVTGTPIAASVPISEVILLVLGLRWWAMFADFISSTLRWQKSAIPPLHIVGLLLAFVIILSPHLLPFLYGQDFLYLLLAVILVPLFWRQGIYYARIGFEYGDLASSFKVNLGLLLGLLLIAILIPQAQGILNALEGAFPLFFLSGIVSLSLARLSHIRKVRNADGSQADPSRTWLIALTALCGIILIFVMVLNAFFSFSIFAFLLTVLGFLGNVLDTVISWLIYGIFFLLTPLFNFLRGLFQHIPTNKPLLPQASKLRPSKHIPQTLPPELIFIGRWIFLALLLLLLLLVFLFVRKSVRQWGRRTEETILEEEREMMDVRAALRERWQEWRNRRKKRFGGMGETLDPTSIRARYRELLRALAGADTALARHSDETPHEYEARLATLSELRPRELEVPSNIAGLTSKEMLQDLTDAYINERYGSTHVDNQRRARIATWIPHLIMQFTGNAGRIVAQRPRRKRLI